MSDAEQGEYDAASVGVRMISAAAADALRILRGEADEARLDEAREIEEGTAPHQDHTYRVRMSYRDESGAWVEHSTREWEATNDFEISEVAEDAGYLLTGLNERGGESTPGRVWQLELWADPTGTGAPDHVHEHTELAPSDSDWANWEIIQAATDENGNVDTEKVRQLWGEHFANQQEGDES
ncbi:hypothetical protein KGD82_16220 [Nocardiopsis eucommiae]|uniref:Uncharacterized protein n=1 Tax=Nocardiopsis eucommiae TaxID=2831970 RepID=A0A975QJI0_9ACTN|nr:hypothetical protein KGD82_16220 [Nocardiopsis eucommiae]